MPIWREKTRNDNCLKYQGWRFWPIAWAQPPWQTIFLQKNGGFGGDRPFTETTIHQIVFETFPDPLQNFSQRPTNAPKEKDFHGTGIFKSGQFCQHCQILETSKLIRICKISDARPSPTWCVCG